MELNNNFTVSASVERTWATLTDIEGIAPCMPGAQLTEIDGDEFRGLVKVKVGPVTAQYKGSASFAERDDEAHRAVISASGRDSRGAGNASAMITAQLRPEGDGTAVEISTDLKVTGKVAQFGRGVMADVSERLLEQFVECLEAKLEAEPEEAASEADEATSEASDEAPAAAAAPAEPSGPRRIEMPEAQPVDLLDTAGAPMLKRAAPILAVLIVLFLLRRRRG